MSKPFQLISALTALSVCCGAGVAYAQDASITGTDSPSVVADNPDALHYEEYPTIRLRSLDKITARTLTFDAQVGTVIKFGDIYIKILSCRKPPAVEKTESAAFLQIWEVDRIKSQSRWIFSGWMFASSPALSGMDHPVYDVWAIDCLGKTPEGSAVQPAESATDQALQGEGEVKEDQIQKPAQDPSQQEAPFSGQERDSFEHLMDHITDAPADEQGISPQEPDSRGSVPQNDQPRSPADSDQPFNGIY